MPRRIAITGSSGCLGRPLVSRLLARGHRRLLLIDPVDATHDPAAELQEHLRSRVQDPRVVDALRDCDTLVHLAFIPPARGMSDAEVERANVEALESAFLAAARAGVPHFVHASSIAVYGFTAHNDSAWLDESAPRRQDDGFYYPRTKTACEVRLDELAAQHGVIDVAVLRPCGFLGPRGGKNLGWLRAPVFPYVQNRPHPVHLAHEDDVADAFVAAIEARATGVFNVATRDPLPPSEWARPLGARGVPIPEAAVSLAAVAYAVGLSSLHPGWLREGQQHPIRARSEKIRAELGWAPELDSAEATLRALSRDGTGLRPGPE